MAFRRTKTKAGCLSALCLGGLLLILAGCQGQSEVAASSTSDTPPGSAARDLAQAVPALPERPAKGSPADIGGVWQARSGDRRFTIELIVEDQGLRGFVRGTDGSVTTIKIGVYSGDAFLFETSGASAGWLWSGEFSPEGLHGLRENVQTGVVEPFTAERLQ